ncbi:uncharacterized protein LOC142337750 isoform X3 [Convolutriloba macropyga]|uniref:uncharacterized protein LOC142337750 isoform X3 n=1 Tax=Convolutriloba macropyga TaxID=536237 RepID=UPI003F51AD91
MSNVEINIGGKYAYRRDCIIGHGSFAIVFKGRTLKEEPKRPVAVKYIQQKNVSKNPKLLQHEISILKQLKHHNVVQLYDCFQDKAGIHLVMEFCNGGDLQDYLNKKKVLSEPVIRMFLKQIASALKLMDDKSIVHRDLKPQNLLLAFDPLVKCPLPEDIRIKVADFGFARYLEVDAMAVTLCGSPMYMAPEVMMHQEYDSRADIWSVGTIIFQCLVGKAPFVFPNPQKLRAFYENNPNLRPNVPEHASSSLKSLLLMILRRDPEHRCTFKEFYAHPFLNTDAISSQIPSQNRHQSGHGSDGSNNPYQIYSKTAPQSSRRLPPDAEDDCDERWSGRISGSPVLTGGFIGGGSPNSSGRGDRQTNMFQLGYSPPQGMPTVPAGVQQMMTRRRSSDASEEEPRLPGEGPTCGVTDQVVCHDDDEYAQNMSSTITSDLDTPEGFVLVPSNIDEFGRVIKPSTSPPQNIPYPQNHQTRVNRNSDASDQSPFYSQQPQPYERQTHQHVLKQNNQLQNQYGYTVSNQQQNVKLYALGHNQTPAKGSQPMQRPLGSVSPIDRHRIITDSQGQPRPSVGLEAAAQPQHGTTLANPFDHQVKAFRTSSERLTGSPGMSKKTALGAICSNVDLPRAVTFHQLSQESAQQQQLYQANLYDAGAAFTSGTNNSTKALGLSPANGMLAPIRNLNNNPVFSGARYKEVYTSGKTHTEPNLFALVPESSFRTNFNTHGPQPFPSGRLICTGGGFTFKGQHGRFWSQQGFSNTNPEIANNAKITCHNALTQLKEHERAVSAPNFTLAMTQANFSNDRHSPIHSSPMRKLSSELLHIAYSPSPPNRKHSSNSENAGASGGSRSSLPKSIVGAGTSYQSPSLNIHEQLCDSNSDLANEVPTLFCVSPSNRRRSLGSLIRGSFDGSENDLASVPRDLSDVNIMTEKERELAQNLTMALSISQCLYKFAITNNDILPGILSDSASDYLKDRDWDLDFPMEINNTTEKIMFLVRSLEVIRNCADQVKETQQEAHFTSKTNLLLRQVHETFSTNLCSLQKMCSENPEYSNLNLTTEQLRNCANGVIYAQALQSCREAALDEQSHCWRKAYYNYRNAQLLLSCLLLESGIENDRLFITRVFQMVEYRLDCCVQNKIAEKQGSSL